MTESEESKSEAADALRESERAISEANRRLFELAGQQRAARRRRSPRLGARRSRASLDERRSASRRCSPSCSISSTCRAQPEPLRLRARTARTRTRSRAQMHYLSYISRAARRADRSAAPRSRPSWTQLAAEAEAKSAGARAACRPTRRSRREQLEQRAARARSGAGAGVGRDRAGSARRSGTCKRDEERLAQLVERLARELGARAARRARGACATSSCRSRCAAGAGRSQELKGRLQLAGDRGTRQPLRQSTGRTAGCRGRACSSAASRARRSERSPAGRVVYADWLRGFGNLLILDHGEGYMSLYGNNESLLKQVGDTVKAGDPIAAVGSERRQPGNGFIL